MAFMCFFVTTSVKLLLLCITQYLNIKWHFICIPGLYNFVYRWQTIQVSRLHVYSVYLKGFYHIWVCWPSWSCDHINLYQCWLTYHKESSIELKVQLAKWFLRKYVLICWWDSNLSDLGWKVKGQPWPLTLIYSHCLIRFNISRENNDFGFNSIQKINSSKNSPFNCIRKQIWPWRWVVQGQFRIIIWTNLVGPTSQMLHTKSQSYRPSGSGEEDFKMFFTIYVRDCHLGHVIKYFS